MLVVFGVCCDGCDKAEKTGEMIRVSVATPTRKVVNYSEIADSISYIQLQGYEDSPIGEIRTLKFIDSLTVAFDRKTQRVLLYDHQGNFLREIGSQGQGPGEYIYCQQIDVDRDKGNVLVYDIAMGVSKRYDMQGNYLGQDTVGRADDIAYIGNGQYLLANYGEERMDLAGIYHVTSSPFVAKKIRACRDDLPLNKPSEFFDYDGQVSIMTRAFEDELLTWTGDSLASVANFDIKENPTKSQISEMKDNWQLRLECLDRMQSYNYKNFVLVYLNYAREGRYMLYDKKSKSVEVVYAMVNDIDSVYGYRLPVSINNSLINIIDKDEELAPTIQIIHLK